MPSRRQMGITELAAPSAHAYVGVGVIRVLVMVQLLASPGAIRDVGAVIGLAVARGDLLRRRAGGAGVEGANTELGRAAGLRLAGAHAPRAREHDPAGAGERDGHRLAAAVGINLVNGKG